MTVALTQSVYAHSSASPIKGNPGFAYELPEYFPKEFTADLTKAIHMVLVEARLHIQRAARFDPYWSQYEDLLSTKFFDGAIEYTLTGPKERVIAAINLEYGTDTEPPHSLLRKEAISQRDHLTLQLSKAMNAEMPHA
jgi:hypothetical protein